MVNPDDYESRKTSNGYVWLKLYTDLVNEPKFMQLSDQAKAIYFETYLLAGKSDAFGLITVSETPATVQDIAWILHRPESDIQESFDALQRAGFIDLDGGVTITKFKTEQGPSMDEKRKQWALDQRKSRARAKGEKLPDEPESDTEKNEKLDEVKELKTEPEQDLKTTTKTKTKSVSRMSDNSQNGVSPDNESNEGVVVFSSKILELWTAYTNKTFSKNDTFVQMVQDWINHGVTMVHVQKAIQKYSKIADTPMYLRDIVLNLRNDDSDIQEQRQLDSLRQFAKELKRGENES